MSRNNIITPFLVLLMVIGFSSSCSKKATQGSASATQVTDSLSSDDTKSQKKSKKKPKKAKKITYNRLIQGTDYNLKYQWALDYYSKKKNDRVIALMEDIAPYFMSTPQEDTVQFYTAVSYFRQGDFESSSMMLDNFRKRFGRSDFIEEAEYLYAMSFYYGSPDPERDQTFSIQGITAFNEFLQRYPETHREKECNEHIVELTRKLYDKELINAKLYYDIGQHKSAVYALKLALKNMPETPHREELLYLIAKSSYILASNSISELQHTRYLDMIDAYYNLISEFPDTKHKKEVAKMYEQAQSYVKSLNKDKPINKEEDGKQEE